MNVITFQGELVVAGWLLHGQTMPALERQLERYGLLPVQATERRWRMDTDTPGNYRLTYTVTLPRSEERPHAGS